jgi:dipeptidyl aminopeptidase/acylaminoacyl peptidase
MPPALLFHGTADKSTPYPGAKAFCEAVRKAGNRCELVTAPDEPHGYMFKNEGVFNDMTNRIKKFLVETGFLYDTERGGKQSENSGVGK